MVVYECKYQVRKHPDKPIFFVEYNSPGCGITLKVFNQWANEPSNKIDAIEYLQKLMVKTINTTN